MITKSINQSINQSIYLSIYLSTTKTHNNPHTHTHAHKRTHTYTPTHTSAVRGLLPEDALQVGGPGALHLQAEGPQGVCVLPLPAADPQLKAQRVVPRGLGHPDVTRLSGKGRR